jgi:anaerobic glycerol-3-phosphate dehydrogenase
VENNIDIIKVTENTEVVNSKGEVILNLYAVGELIFGNTFNNYYPSSGTGMGTSVYTGAIVARHIVEQIN